MIYRSIFFLGLVGIAAGFFLILNMPDLYAARVLGAFIILFGTIPVSAILGVWLAERKEY